MKPSTGRDLMTDAQRLAAGVNGRRRHAKAWCHCAAPAPARLRPFTCRSCRQELHVETLVALDLSPRALAARRLWPWLTSPIVELLPAPSRRERTSSSPAPARR